MSKQLVHSCNNNADDEILPVGSAKTLQRAMTVTKLSEMLDCIKDMKSYASTIEKDLPEYLETNPIYRNNDTNSVELEKTDDFIQLANQRFNNNRYVLLNDLIEQKKVCLLNIKIRRIFYFVLENKSIPTKNSNY